MRILSFTKQTECGAENKFFRVLFFTILFVIFLASSCTQTKVSVPKSPAEPKPPAANPPPVTQIDDAKIKQLLKPNGKPLLVNFWATWCGPCREEFPDLVKLDEEFRGKIDFITVSLDFVEELNTGVPNFLRETNAQMPTYLLVSKDENALVSSISKDWSGALPFTILYNEKGEITYSQQEKIKPETLKSEIKKTLGE